MHHVQQGSVVLIDQDNHLLTGLGVGTFNETFQTLVRINSALITSVYLLVTIQFPLQLTQKPILVHMLRRAHVEMKHRIPCPLLLQALDGQVLEQFLSPLKITMERRSKQRLPETAGTAQEYITRCAVCHSVDQFPSLNLENVCIPIGYNRRPSIFVSVYWFVKTNITLFP